jgi:hypothetical protein
MVIPCKQARLAWDTQAHFSLNEDHYFADLCVGFEIFECLDCLVEGENFGDLGVEASIG